MRPRRVAFIINPAAGASRGRERWTKLQAGFHQDGAQEKVLFTSQPGDAVRFAQELARECDVVAAVGGDGTLFEVTSGLLLSGATHTHLAIVPLGTGNDAAHLCGIGDVAQARLAFRGARTQTLDVVRIHCHAQETPIIRYALLYGAVGIAGEAVKRTTARVKRVFGPRLSYPVGALCAIWAYTAPRMRVICDGQTWENQFLLVSASNAELSGGGMRLAPGARMDDGLLDINVCEAMRRWPAAALLWQICRGRRPSHPKLRYFPARTVAVEASPPIEVTADGELIGHTPAQFEVVPQALRVLVP